MQKTLILTLAIWFIIHTVSLNTIAQETPDWHLQHLPKHAKARFGKSGITGNIALSNDGTRLAVACSAGIWVYDAHTDMPLHFLAEHTDSVMCVAFSPDGTMLVSGSHDKSVRLWDVQMGTLLLTMQGHEGRTGGVAFSPDAKTLASGSKDTTIRLWDAETGAHLRTLTGHTDDVTSVAFSPDGKTLASSSDDKTLRLWDVQTGESMRTFSGHALYVFDVAFTPDGEKLASAGGDKTVRNTMGCADRR